LAGRHPVGWLVCVVSSTLWLPTLVMAAQWVAVFNCGLSIAICLRNFVKWRAALDPPPALRTVEPAGAPAGSAAGRVSGGGRW
jgi:hypothetical protein